MLLRSMQQAIYTPANSGHFGLAFEAYTHFTSPIRRYPDLLVHRVIKAILAKKTYKLPVRPPEPAGRFKIAKKPAPGAVAKVVKPLAAGPDASGWEAAGLHCSAFERRADEASRDVEAWLKCKFMREHLGEEYGGVVTAVTGFGLFVTLDNLYVEGLVHITELGGDFFRLDEVRQELRGERTGIRFAIGTRVRIQVSRVDLDGRKIDFRLVTEGTPLTSKGLAASGLNVPPPARGKRSGKGLGKASAPQRAAKSPIQALKAAVKKAVAKGKGRKKR
jgi:ribonuclease R